MYKPTAGELIGGIAHSLRTTVLPTLTDATAQRQLRAALHAMGRLRHAWDRLPGYLADDNLDLRNTLAGLLSTLRAECVPCPEAIASIEARLAALGRNEGDATWPAAGLANEALQALVIELEETLRDLARDGHPKARAALLQLEPLYRRMIERELAAWAASTDE